MAHWTSLFGSFATQEDVPVGTHKGILVSVKQDEGAEHVIATFEINGKRVTKWIGTDSNKALYRFQMQLKECGVDVQSWGDSEDEKMLNIPVKITVTHSEKYVNVDDFVSDKSGAKTSPKGGTKTNAKPQTQKTKPPSKQPEKEESSERFITYEGNVYHVLEEEQNGDNWKLKIETPEGDQYYLDTADGDVWEDATLADGEAAGFNFPF